MATLGYAYSDAALSPPFSTSGRRSMGQAGGAGGGHRRTCWMLFEYMNKGMLVVSQPGWRLREGCMLQATTATEESRPHLHVAHARATHTTPHRMLSFVAGSAQQPHR
jgi:hypothetical protein